MSPLKLTGWVVAGVGGLGLGVGLGFGGAAISQASFSNQYCPTSTQCTSQTGVNLRSNAVSLGNVSTGMVIVGGVVAAAGVVLVLVAPSDTGSGLKDVAVGVSPSAMTVTGRF